MEKILKKKQFKKKRKKNDDKDELFVIKSCHTFFVCIDLFFFCSLFDAIATYNMFHKKIMLFIQHTVAYKKIRYTHFRSVDI